MSDQELLQALKDCEFTPQNYCEDFHNVDFGEGSDVLKMLWADVQASKGELRSRRSLEYRDLQLQVKRIKLGVFTEHEDVTEDEDHDEDGRRWHIRLFFPKVGKTVLAEFYYDNSYNTINPEGWTVVNKCGTSIAETQQVK